MSKKQTNDKPTRRRRKVILENDPRVVAWCEQFIGVIEAAQGYKPTKDQALLAFLTKAFEALNDAWKEPDTNRTVTFDASEPTQ